MPERLDLERGSEGLLESRRLPASDLVSSSSFLRLDVRGLDLDRLRVRLRVTVLLFLYGVLELRRRRDSKSLGGKSPVVSFGFASLLSGTSGF